MCMVSRRVSTHPAAEPALRRCGVGGHWKPGGFDLKKVILAVTLALALAACDSADVKAAKQLAAAKEYVAQGDVPRALVELRNALKNDETLTEARLLFAELLLERGRNGDALGQYRYVVEKDPSNLDATRAIALLAFDAMSWDDARKYDAAGLAMAPEDTELLAVKAGLDYRAAAEPRNVDEMERAASAAQKLLDADPTLIRARRVVLADAIRRDDLQGAVALADEGLKFAPEDRDLNNVRLVVLGRLGDKDKIEQQILSMISLFPADEEIGRLLVEFYLSTGRVDEAEAWLRARIKPDAADPNPRKVLLRFLAQVRSEAAMRDELAKVLAQDPLPADVAADEEAFRALKAGADYVLGDRDAAMSALEEMIKGAEPSDKLDTLKVQLARMRLGAGNMVGARALVEEVLAHDPGQAGALKLKGGWLIDEDNTQEAVRILRDGLADAPNDPQLLTLLARAYQREGRPELMADMLARAVEVSQQAPDESLRYATYLAQQGQNASAETVLIDALRRRPDSFDLLSLLAQVHLAMKDWPRAEQDIAAIRQRFSTDKARALADELQARLLQGQGRSDALGDFLADLASKSDGALAPRIAVIRNTVRSGRLDQAAAEAQALLADAPDAPEAKLLIAQIELAQGQGEAALATMQALVAAHPEFEAGWTTLYGQQMRAGDSAGASATIKAAAAAQPGNPTLQILHATDLERTGDIDGAIAIYEALYAQDSDNLVVANNLASLLASTRADSESLDRAWTVARRLNGARHPAFQDTYGWLAFRRGDTTAALVALEPAAKGLPGDPSVAYHLARTYAALGRKDEARAEYQRGADLVAKGAQAYPGLGDEIAAGLAELGQP